MMAYKKERSAVERKETKDTMLTCTVELLIHEKTKEGIVTVYVTVSVMIAYCYIHGSPLIVSATFMCLCVRVSMCVYVCMCVGSNSYDYVGNFKLLQ